MTEEPDDTSLSFLDVMTNGLGSLLVLFFLMAALQVAGPGVQGEQSTLDRLGDEGGRLSGRARLEPFLILVKAPPEGTLFAGPAQPWQIEGDATFARTARTSVGLHHALLLADQLPGPGCRIRLAGVKPAGKAAGELWIFAGEKVVRTGPLPAPVQGRIEAWPVEEKNAP